MEAKFLARIAAFEITKHYVDSLKNKINAFKTATHTQKTVFLTLITSNGVIENAYYHQIIDNHVSFEEHLPGL